MSPLRAATSGIVLLVGAGVYAVVHGLFHADFSITPLMLGITAVVAGLLGSRRRVVATGLVLAGWGSAVLLVAHEVIPRDRTTPAYMLGVAVGLLAASFAGRAQRVDWLTSGSIAAFAGPLFLYLSYDIGALGRWPAWALTTVAWAGWELYWGLEVDDGMHGHPRPKARR